MPMLGCNPWLQHFSKLRLVDNSNAKFFCLIELAAGLRSGEDVIGFLTNATRHVAAARFDLFRRFLARH